MWGVLTGVGAMMATLSERFSRVYEDLDALNRNLEARVDDRTRELRASEQEALESRQRALEAGQAKSAFLSCARA